MPSIWTGLFPLTLKLSLSHSDLDDWSFVWVQCPWMKSIYQMEFAIGCTEEKKHWPVTQTATSQFLLEVFDDTTYYQLWSVDKWIKNRNPG